MSVRVQIVTLVFMTVQSVLFGVGTVLVLATPLAAFAMQLMPWVVGVSALVSMPLSWMIAPRLRSRFGNRSTSLPPSVVGYKPAPQGAPSCNISASRLFGETSAMNAFTPPVSGWWQVRGAARQGRRASGYAL